MSLKYLREQPGEPKSMYKGYNEALIELARANSDIVVLYADFPQGEAGPFFKREYPDRIYNLGIAEADMMTVAAGLAEAGKIPFTHCHSIFAVGRAFNQIRQIAFDRLNVKMILCNTGMFWTFMGGSHQIIEDIASLRAVPDLVLISPSDSIEARKAAVAAAKHIGPVAIRLAEPRVPVLFRDDYRYEIGKALVLREGDDLAIISTGIMLRSSLEAATELENEGIDSRVINISTIKPLDEDVIKNAAKETDAIVTVEDSNILGGLGGAVAEAVSESYPVPIRRVGVRDRFGQTGSMEELAAEYNMASADIVKAAKEVIKKKSV
jgi:transketolase